MLATANVFVPLIDVFETVLKFFHNSGGISWGLSIVLLTIAVRAVLIPLTFRQIKSMVRMQGLSPQMKEIQAKYKDDKQRQQQEIMKFYKANNVNPLGSCLPLVLQLPVFISLYYMLKKNLRNDICPKTQALFREAYHTAHHVTLAAAHSETTACGHVPAAHFLFIHDLTAKATGVELGILVVLYVGSQLGSSLLMSAATMDPTQRKVMLFMPLIFVLFVIRFPAGLLLYWITTNLWTVIQQYTVRRYIGPTVAVVPAGAGVSSSKTSGGGALTGSAGTGNGSGGGVGGGLGARLRDRLSAAQSAGAEGRAEKVKALKSNGNGEVSSGSGSSGKGGAPSAKTSSGARGRSANGTQHGGDGSSAAVTGSSSKASSGRGRRGASSPNGTGSGNGDGSAVGGSGNGARAGAPPPRPPRKKKKRSGRRR
jgi:YidC/Oxa1 family membrane protein insertase